MEGGPPPSAKPYPFIEGTPVVTDNARHALNSLRQQRSPLATNFFSASNMAHIQIRLRTIIKERTGYEIDRQDDMQLLIIMRGIYVDHAQHGRSIPHEVQRLDGLVLREIVPQVATGIAQHIGYLRDASTLPVPLNRGVATSIKGQNTLELFRGL